MKKGLAALFLGMVIILGACGNADDTNSDSAENLEAGEEVYRNNCANCHGADLSGNGGPELLDIGSKYSQEQIEDIVQEGIGSMPPQSQVEGQDLEELASWLIEQ
ncbi:cytochrome c' [Oceanobacillus oncorhynchi subsp. incaldanensis]|uniref:Cytochrome c-551 n=2 Tax=Oceanobacillus TaxID=182709 RepID=A0A0A1MNG3_9BACI|nr:cytochrome c [Oceanobacillus oncorhynchi]MDM8098763.1 cytochrome c [Oceanobacillus oncorhynchi]UUI39158.1 cytochrome c [Oceanobacillus oncorhynchi]GIO17886.1 cytochrome c' [Oceanobacillus oncorhynchi subsp. incaldanensis]CEI81207.1 Cytochrome c-551 precursor [Oceanobacillus oncorhynchi]